MSGAEVATTARLRLRELSCDDDAFVVELLNDEAFLRFIGDRGVRDPEGARAYLREGPLASYQSHGFGLWRVEQREDATAIGMCGLLQRPQLDAPDIGFAYLPEFRANGYGTEAARAVIRLARERFQLPRVLAVTQEDNRASIALLARLGMTRAGSARLEPDGPDLELYELRFDERATPESAANRSAVPSSGRCATP